MIHGKLQKLLKIGGKSNNQIVLDCLCLYTDIALRAQLMLQHESILLLWARDLLH